MIFHKSGSAYSTLFCSGLTVRDENLLRKLAFLEGFLNIGPNNATTSFKFLYLNDSDSGDGQRPSDLPYIDKKELCPKRDAGRNAVILSLLGIRSYDNYHRSAR